MSQDDFLCKNSIEFCKANIVPFYYQVIKCWFDFHSKEPAPKFTSKEMLWNNKFILIDNKPVNKLFCNWKKQGINRIEDIVNGNGIPYTCIELRRKYNVAIKQMDYNSLINAIPSKWKTNVKLYAPTITNANEITVYINESSYKLDCLNNKTIYNILIKRIATTPTALHRWIDEFPFLSDTDFARFFQLPNLVATDTKMQVFQFKILHRIIPCKLNLKRWGISEHDVCNTCGIIETIEHLFFYCNDAQNLWKRIEYWIQNTLDIHIHLSVVGVLFGVPFQKNDPILLSINHIILVAKRYIYKTKLENHSNHLNQSLFSLNDLNELKSSIYIEHFIEALHMEPNVPNKWNTLHDVLS